MFRICMHYSYNKVYPCLLWYEQRTLNKLSYTAKSIVAAIIHVSHLDLSAYPLLLNDCSLPRRLGVILGGCLRSVTDYATCIILFPVRNGYPTPIVNQNITGHLAPPPNTQTVHTLILQPQSPRKPQNHTPRHHSRHNIFFIDQPVPMVRS